MPKPTKPAAGIEETDSPPGQTPKGIPDDRRIAKSDSDRIVDAILGNKLAQANSLRSEATGRPVVDYGYLNGVFTEYTFYPDGSFKWEPAKKGPSRPTYTQPANAWAAQGVPSYQPFRVHSSGLPYNESHTCPQCGLTSPDGEGTWIVQNELPNGRHTHTCPRCSASWYH